MVLSRRRQKSTPDKAKSSASKSRSSSSATELRPTSALESVSSENHRPLPSSLPSVPDSWPTSGGQLPGISHPSAAIPSSSFPAAAVQSPTRSFYSSSAELSSVHGVVPLPSWPPDPHRLPEVADTMHHHHWSLAGRHPAVPDGSTASSSRGILTRM